jgi:hypothetical protein
LEDFGIVVIFRLHAGFPNIFLARKFPKSNHPSSAVTHFNFLHCVDAEDQRFLSEDFLSYTKILWIYLVSTLTLQNYSSGNEKFSIAQNQKLLSLWMGCE